MVNPSNANSERVVYEGAINSFCTLPAGQKFKKVGFHSDNWPYGHPAGARPVFAPCTDEEAESGYYVIRRGLSAQCKRAPHFVVDPNNGGFTSAALSREILRHTVPQTHILSRLFQFATGWLNK